MKAELIDLIGCPVCGGTFTLTPGRREGAEIMDGTLKCGECAKSFPILRGVPRFVESGAYAESFGYEWNRFPTVQIDGGRDGSTESERQFAANTGLTRADVEGRVVLDAGVGAGRYAEVVSRWGATVIGADLTIAVDAAFANIGRRPNVHLVQADIFALPLRPESVDVAYSIGVLHHTPSTEGAFARVAATVKKGGQLAIYVYHAAGMARHFSDAFRHVTTRLPRPVVNALSLAAIPLYYPYRLPYVGRVLQTVAPISMHPRWRWRWLDTFDWYSPRYQWKHDYPEVFRWYKAAGFTVVDLPGENVCARGIKG